MGKLANIGKKVLIILGIVAGILVIGLAGQLDHDEYIEANSTPKVQILQH